MRLLLMSAAIALAAATTAQAEPVDTVVVKGRGQLADNQRLVSYGDLQVGTYVGRAKLERRVSMAIADLCDPSRFSVAEPHDSMRCTAQAWSEITPQLDRLSPRLASR